MSQDDRATYHETIVPSTVTGISASYLSIAGAHPTRTLPTKAKVSVETNSIHYLTTGGNPSSDPDGVGHTLEAGDEITIYGYRDIQNFRCINKTAGSNAKVKVTVYFP